MGLVHLKYKKEPDQGENDFVEIFFNKACKIDNNNNDLDKRGPLSVNQLARITNSYFCFSHINLKKFNVFQTKIHV